MFKSKTKTKLFNKGQMKDTLNIKFFTVCDLDMQLGDKNLARDLDIPFWKTGVKMLHPAPDRDSVIRALPKAHLS